MASASAKNKRPNQLRRMDLYQETFETGVLKDGAPAPPLYSTNTPEQVFPQNPRWAFGRRGRAGLIAVFSPVSCHAVGAGALAGRAIAILSIVFGFAEAFFCATSPSAASLT
jgi:hypothetical protein